MMKILIGDIFETKKTTLVNTINCVGVMGKGIALRFKSKYPEMFEDYKKRCEKHLVKPGEPYFYYDLAGASIINFPTKDDWRSMSNIKYVISGLKWFVNNYKHLGIKSIAFPPLGCGNGGLVWEDVGPIMYNYLKDLPIDIEIYAPFGTKREYLTPEYLSNKNWIQKNIGTRLQNIKKESFCILEIIYRLNLDLYASYIGRVSYQKLCYFATREGLNAGFSFKKNYYGPYSEEAKKAFAYFSNLNLIYEAKKGKMDAIIVTDNYLEYRKKYEDILLINSRAIEKTVDLFSRIKNTRQAEVYSTILYAYENSNVRTFESIIEFIKKWKKTWSSNDHMIQVQEGIRDLTYIGYITVS